MLFMPLPFMRGFGLGGLMIPAVSVVAALTVLPVLLSFLGRPLRPRALPAESVVERRADYEGNFWARLAKPVMRRPVPVAARRPRSCCSALRRRSTSRSGRARTKGLPQNLEGVQGMNALSAAVGAGALAPTDIIVDTGRSGGPSDPAVQEANRRLMAGLKADPEVAQVRFEAKAAVRRRDRQVPPCRGDRPARLRPAPAQDFVERLRDSIIPAATFPHGVAVRAGGGPPGGVDFLDLTFGAFPYLVLGVLLVTYVLLVRAFRSLLLPLKAIVMNLLSIGAAYGLLVVDFQWGWGEPFGLIQADQIEGWIPVMLFAMLFGLSMDYEVFLVSRMREEWDRGVSNEQAVANGLAKTGRIVTAAGAVMFAAFFGFVAGSVVGLQQFGFGLAIAVLIDVTIVRALLVPSVMKLMGRWNWWLPTRSRRRSASSRRR